MRAPFILATLIVMLAPGSTAGAADIEAGKAQAEPCAACHGPDGRSTMDGVPSLAGQPDQFIQWQLVYFRSGTRKDPVMQALAAPLSNADIRNLGAYFASLSPAPPLAATSPQKELMEKGATLAARHNCGSCHAETYAGQQAVSRLAGQREEYLVKALRDFKSGARTGGGVAAMPGVAYRLTADDIVAVAHYLARLPATP
jgi:cytochrome c553